MYEMDQSDELLRLRAADPVTLVEVQPSAVDVLLERARDGRVTRSRKRTASWVAIGAVSAAAVAIGVPAAADHLFSAQTGSYGIHDAENTESDDSEVIFTSADDFVEYTATIYPSWMPLPAGISGEEVRVRVASAMQASSDLDIDAATGTVGAHAFETGIIAGFEFEGQCLWMDEFVTAHALADDARIQNAATVLKSAATWPAIVATDGGGVVDHLVQIAEAAEAGDVRTVAADVSLNCEGKDLEAYGR